jgi:hypothetical protein
MSNRIRRGLFAAAGLVGGLAGQSARADGDIEKPPGVPPEVTAAKTACPTLTGPCHGFYPTRWRVLSDCCAGPAGPVAPAPMRPTDIPPASRLRAGTAEKAPTRPEAVSVPAPTAARAESLPTIKPLSARSEMYAAPSPKPASAAVAPDIVIPPPPVSAPTAAKVEAAPAAPRSGANRPLAAVVVPETSKLRK